MSEDIKSLSDLNTISSEDVAAVEITVPRVAIRDDLGRSYATGKRKDAVARVWIKPGSGKIVVNEKEMNGYFARPVLQMILRQPFQVAGVEDQFDVKATVKGGGLSGQAGAVKHGISKALQLYDPSLRAALKSAGVSHEERIETTSGLFNLTAKSLPPGKVRDIHFCNMQPCASGSCGIHVATFSSFVVGRLRDHSNSGRR